MAKRKSKRFAGSPEYHAAEFSNAAHAFSSQAAGAHASLASGRCLAAGKAIDEAYELKGRADAHRESLDQTRHNYDTSDDQAAYERGKNMLRAMDKVFEKVCVRAKPAKK